jgi:hypothetical protein
MTNPFMAALGGGQGPMGNFAQMVQQFNQFKANFKGDPKAEVEKLLQSGRLNQQQLNQLQQMATQACDTRNTVQNATRDIIDANNQNSRAILDFLTQSKLSDLQTENQNLKLAASQAAQNNYLISQLRPCPSPAYITCNPWAGSGYGGCGCNQGCGC